MTKNNLDGQLGEHLAAVDLLKEGFSVSFSSPGLPYDLIAELDGVLYRVQVKASSGYTFYNNTAHRSYDVCAFVNIVTGEVAYISAKHLNKRTQRFKSKINKFKVRAAINSLLSA
jgi:hypothetical protein